jgi:hypothetical protein
VAEAAVTADAEYRERLIAEAERVVEQWRVEGYLGKAVQHSPQVSLVRNS